MVARFMESIVSPAGEIGDSGDMEIGYVQKPPTHWFTYAKVPALVVDEFDSTISTRVVDRPCPRIMYTDVFHSEILCLSDLAPHCFAAYYS